MEEAYPAQPPAGGDLHESRFMRERDARNKNPFHSPPSSTGSRGTDSPTASSAFSDADGESTRRLNEQVALVTGPRRYAVNRDVAHRKWPEFYAAPKETKITATAAAPAAATAAAAAAARSRAFSGARGGASAPRGRGSSSGGGVDAERLRRAISASIHSAPPDDDSTHETTWMGSNRTRAEMQPRVDNDSDNVLSMPPARSPAPRLADMANQQQQQPTAAAAAAAKLGRSSSSDAKLARAPPLGPPQAKPAPPAHATPQTKPSSTGKGNPSRPLPAPLTNSSLNRLNMANSDQNNNNNTANLTSRSFIMPDISHLDDFMAGDLRYSYSTRNGLPIFVKNGRVHDSGAGHRPGGGASNGHADVDGLEVPEDEERIFVSMEVLRQEIMSLQEHDDLVLQHAEELQLELREAQARVHELESERVNDSGLGLGSESARGVGSRTSSDRLAASEERRAALESELISVQKELEEANRRAASVKSQSTDVSGERDRANRKLQDACENIADMAIRQDRLEHELHSTRRQLDDSKQVHLDNETLRQDLLTSRRGAEALRGENASLRTENSSLRADAETLRRDHEALMSENQVLRASSRALTREVEDLRRELEVGRRELEAARAERQAAEQEHTVFRADYESVVRHNEKYFGENKMLRKENADFERNIHILHDENMKLRDENEFLKQQLDHCRPIGKELDESEEIEDADEDVPEESAFFLPDISALSHDVSAMADLTTTQSEQAATNPRAHHTRTATRDATYATTTAAPTKKQRQRHREVDATVTEEEGQQKQEQASRNPSATRGERQHERAPAPATPQPGGGGKAATSRAANNSQKVAFSLPVEHQEQEQDTPNKTGSNVANRGSKRRSVSTTKTKQQEQEQVEPSGVIDDTTGLQSVDNSNMHSIGIADVIVVAKGRKEAASKPQRSSSGKEPTVTRDNHNTAGPGAGAGTSTAARSQIKRAVSGSAAPAALAAAPTTTTTNFTKETTAPHASCPALSPSARRVLDTLCEHSCRNCTVCTRITGHRHLSAGAEGKKRVSVSRPVPVTDRADMLEDEDATERPSRPPGEALALVIKCIEDEAEHIKMELSTLNARYFGHDPSVARRGRHRLHAAILSAFERSKAKADQIYALHDVLVGLRQSGQAMGEEELEMTVYEAMGASLRDITGCSVGEVCFSHAVRG